MSPSPQYLSTCVYTIVHSQVLHDAYEGDRTLVFEEGKRWSKARELLVEARHRDLLLPIIFAPGENIWFLAYHAVLDGIELAPDRTFKPQTRVTVSALTPFSTQSRKKTSLVVASTGEHISDGHIRPYVICKTPRWLPGVERSGPSAAARNSSLPTLPEEIRATATFREGDIDRILVNRYERDPRARAACIAHYGAYCYICGFSFGDKYGPKVQDYIHVHHIIPLASVGASYSVNPIRDLRPVCPNCHAIIHTSDPPLEPEAVKRLIKAARRRR